jgi:hypothetical protein
MKQLFALFLIWPGGNEYLVATDLDVFQCAGRAAMERLADERWRVRCEPQQNAFKVVKRR